MDVLWRREFDMIMMISAQYYQLELILSSTSNVFVRLIQYTNKQGNRGINCSVKYPHVKKLGVL